MSNKIRTIIIDDEKNALEVLKIQLLDYCSNVDLVAECNSGSAGIEAIKKHKPDLVFLDIEMPHINGFDVLNATNDQSYKVIFTTAYNQFAVRAFKYSALDYLLKPIDIEELKDAVQKVKTYEPSELEARITSLLSNIKQQQKPKVALPIGDSIQLFDTDDIVRFESDSNYTHLFLHTGKKITTAKTLKEVSIAMDGSNFCRVHQSHLINLSCVAKIMRGDNMYVVLNDDTNIPVSRNKREEFLERFRRL
jgi:two-component system, LytTR family, response regulator